MSAGQVRDAMAAVPRTRFLPEEIRMLAAQDRPLPIGHGATNSQPWTVAYMLRLLAVQPGDAVLDVGSGSGWTTALLAHLTGEQGSVIGVDIVPTLVAMARASLGNDWPWARVEQAPPGVLGWPEGGPYDRILVSADGRRVPEPLVDQLAPGGRLVVPAANEMWVVDKDAEGSVTSRATGDLFTFVPLR